MRHFSDNDLVLFYYGEHPQASAVESHLERCSRCANQYEALSHTLLRVVLPPDPELAQEAWGSVLTHVRDRIRRDDQPQWAAPRFTGWQNVGVAALMWIVPVLYPLSLRAIFESGRLAREYPTPGVPLVVLAVVWTLAAPAVAVFGLNRIQGHIDGGLKRLVIYGALVAAITPTLFNVLARTGLVPGMWYGAIALAGIAALLPMPEFSQSSTRLRQAHRLSGLLILLFAAAHVANQAFAIVSLPAHDAVASVLRIVYRQPLVEMSLLVAVGLQVGTGLTIWRDRIRGSTISETLQAVSGFYLAAFFLGHVATVVLARYHQTETDFVWAAGTRGLLVSPELTSLLPYYLLGIIALFVHAGVYARVKALGFLPELSVQRLSYAAIAFGGVMVVTIGLALCGIRLVP